MNAAASTADISIVRHRLILSPKLPYIRAYAGLNPRCYSVRERHPAGKAPVATPAS